MTEAKKFQYHVPRFDFFKADPSDPKSTGYSISWLTYGLLRFSAIVKGETKHTMLFIHPGRGNPNRFAAGDVVELTIRIPTKGDCVEVFCHRAEPSGKLTCRFKLTGLPLKGHFGWHNSKWYSHARVHRLRWRPLAASD